LDDKINGKELYEGCKEKEIKKLTDKCENEEMARSLYECKRRGEGINYYDSDYIK